ncbi:MAG: phosphopeptide-binding protein, partial [Actinomycetota bacterium]|nr:phosphopeptide-binding protein [Actinomycetota bacterium]
PAPPIGTLPLEYPATELPDEVGGLPVLGLSDVDLGPVAFDPDGVMLLAGPPGSGRTNAAAALTLAVRRAEPDVRCYLVAEARSALRGAIAWTDVASTPEQITALAQNLVAAVEDEGTEGRIVVVVESINDYLQGPADKPLVDLIKAVKRSRHTLIADADTASWGPTWPLLGEIKAARRGLLLQPDASEGEILLKTALPRVQRSELPPGRGFFVARGKFVRVQLPWVLTVRDGD